MKNSICNDYYLSITFRAFTLSACGHLALLALLALDKKPVCKAKSFLSAELSFAPVFPASSLSSSLLTKARPQVSPQALLKAKKSTKNLALSADAPGFKTQGLENNFEHTGNLRREEPLLLNADQARVDYPVKARRERIEGSVRLLLSISPQGLVIKARVISSPAYILQTAALKLAPKLRFLPATDNLGQARLAEIEHEVIFRLHES